uniref:Secreted protein n=1 Tax=Globodera pallida TaxID=36090 RepID=A0A183CK04_GLOPA
MIISNYGGGRRRAGGTRSVVITVVVFVSSGVRPLAVAVAAAGVILSSNKTSTPFVGWCAAEMHVHMLLQQFREFKENA